MSRIEELHHAAMEATDRGIAAKRGGDLDKALAFFRQALEFEREAAQSARRRAGFEPTRSILLRSAASLALECNDAREAERLACEGLAGEPPLEIADELRDIIEQAQFTRHLALKGLVLAPSEVQLSIAGPAVGLGYAETEDFITRVESVRRMLYRTAERKLGKPYRERGEPGVEVRENYQVFVSVPRAASFAVSIRLGAHDSQMTFPFHTSPAEIIDDALQNLELLEQGKADEIRGHISDAAYYRNFVALAKQLAPSGETVTLVGLTVTRPGTKREVALTRVRRSIASPVQTQAARSSGDELLTIKGQLEYADARHATPAGRIKITQEDGKEYDVCVPKGMMADIVRPLWEQTVVVDAVQRRKKVILQDIRRA